MASSRPAVRRVGGVLLSLVVAAALAACGSGTSSQPARDALVDAPCARVGSSEPAAGALSWDDEFDGTSVDPSRWTVHDQTTLSFDQARILAANVSVHDGVLDVAARRAGGQGQGRAYTTGYLDSIGHFSQQYGRWEIRAELPTGATASRGLWPAFWLRSDDGPGEVDVAEAWGGPSDRADARPTSYRWTVWKDTTRATGSAHADGWGTRPGAAPVGGAFHTYAVDWSPSCFVFSLDGSVVGSVRTSAAGWLRSSFAGAMNMRLNLQVGSTYWGEPDATTVFPAHLLVDWVRVYRAP